MEYTEEKVLSVLQNAVDFLKEERESGCDDTFASEQYKHFRWFVESLTGKKVGVKNWKVFLKEEA